jgi:hypothetical protein
MKHKGCDNKECEYHNLKGTHKHLIQLKTTHVWIEELQKEVLYRFCPACTSMRHVNEWGGKYSKHFFCHNSNCLCHIHTNYPDKPTLEVTIKEPSALWKPKKGYETIGNTTSYKQYYRSQIMVHGHHVYLCNSCYKIYKMVWGD